MKKYILIAGVNGAGKSTLYQTLHSLHEMILAVSQLKECFEKGVTFNQETTLCGKSVIKNIKKAKEKRIHY